MKVLDYMERYGHEQLVVCHEPSVGLRAFIAVHDTTLGPACEIRGVYRAERAREMTERIYETTQEVLHVSREEEVPPSVAADRLAERRLEAARSLRTIRR